MRTVKILLLLTILPVISYSQTTFPIAQNGEVVYTDVVELDGLTKQRLYDNAKLWVVSSLKSGDNMVELGGDNSDQIIGTGNLLIGTHDVSAGYFREARNVTLNFKFLIFVKDGRYKYEVSNFTLRYLAWWSDMKIEQIDTDLIQLEVRGINQKNTEKAQEILAKEIKIQLEALIRDFQESMKNSNNDDW